MTYLQDADLTLYNGDALEVLRTLPDESVHMCVTSPPFYGLRDYGTGTWQGGDAECDHLRPPNERDASSTLRNAGANTHQNHAREPWPTGTCGKCGATRIDQQIGLEETPEQWVQKLVEVFREVWRVLRKDGTLWLEVGDSYASMGSKNTAGSSDGEVGRAAQAARRGRVEWEPRDPGDPHAHFRWKLPGGQKPKDLIGAPWLLAFALRADGWYLRSDIVWSRPNPMPESVTDRPTKSHSYVFLLSKSARYYWDAEAVREAHAYDGRIKTAHDHAASGSHDNHKGMADRERWANPAGRNVRSVWNIATQPYPEAHFATYPEELVRRCILAGTSERGCCPECGAPWVREVERGELVGTDRGGNYKGREIDPGVNRNHGTPGLAYEQKTLGWYPSCQCAVEKYPNVRPWDVAAVPCTVLDPFFGSGTTGLVARKHGRRTIGIELSADYCELAARRVLKKQTRTLPSDLEPAGDGTLNLLSEAGA